MLVLSRSEKKAPTSSTKRVRVGREAEELGELADDDRDRQPVHVADLDLLGQQVGDEPELAEAQADLDEADHERQHPGHGDRAGGVVRPRASGVMAAKISGETDESGPRTSTRDGPRSAYTTRQAIVV